MISSVLAPADGGGDLVVHVIVCKSISRLVGEPVVVMPALDAQWIGEMPGVIKSPAQVRRPQWLAPLEPAEDERAVSYDRQSRGALLPSLSQSLQQSAHFNLVGRRGGREVGGAAPLQRCSGRRDLDQRTAGAPGPRVASQPTVEEYNPHWKTNCRHSSNQPTCIEIEKQ